jgi:hypothetical protein
MSYELIDAKWGAPSAGLPSGEITWSADLSDDLKYDAGSYDQSDFDEALAAAFESWEDVAAVDFEYVDTFSTADVTVAMAELSGNVVGQATITAVPTSGSLNRITDVDILLDSMETWSPLGPGGSDFFAVAAHEIGHSIGLDHVKDPEQLMNAVLQTDELGDGDIEGAQYLYGTDEGDRMLDLPPDTESDDEEMAESDDGDGDGDGGGGGGSGGGILLLLGGLVALVAGLFGGGGAAAGAVTLAARKSEDGSGGEGVGEDTGGEDLLAFLHESLGEEADSFEEVHQSFLDEETEEEFLVL